MSDDSSPSGLYPPSAGALEKIRGLLGPDERLAYVSAGVSNNRSTGAFWLVTDLRIGMVTLKRFGRPDTGHLYRHTEFEDLGMSSRSEYSKLTTPVFVLSTGPRPTIGSIEKAVAEDSSMIATMMRSMAQGED